MYKVGKTNGCLYKVNSHGDCYTMNGSGEWIHRNWRKNADGYLVVSAIGYNLHGEKISRSLAVHRLVALQFVEGYFDGAEVNHKDFNKLNPDATNLEWVSHEDNIRYSYDAGHYVGKFGKENPNYGNQTLSQKYRKNPNLAIQSQSRPRAQNGRAKKCVLYQNKFQSINFNCQRDAVDYLINQDIVKINQNKEGVIKYLKRPQGYKGWFLKII